MANFVMLRLAEEYQQKYPQASEVVKNDRYMDDLIHSCTTAQEAGAKMKEIETMLSKGSFQVKKWHCSEISKAEKVAIKEEGKRIELDSEVIKTLGVVWNSPEDSIEYRVCLTEMHQMTKRNILSAISRIFDPLGLASVVTIRPRIALQGLWKSGYDWDQELPEDQCKVWREMFVEMESLNTLKYPRFLKAGENGDVELHIFADASEKAYGAVAYLLWREGMKSECSIVIAKAKVAPVKQTTIPRLELMAALVASRMAKTIQAEMRTNFHRIVVWTDSKIVLYWIRADSATLKPFVGVRIAEIQENKGVEWRHVPSDLNPADDLSRGLIPEEIPERWYSGPAFLRDTEDIWPETMINDKSDMSQTEFRSRNVPVYSLTTEEDTINCQNFSSWKVLVRVTAYVNRFISNCRAKVQKRETEKGGLQPEELNKAEEYWFKKAQKGLTKTYPELTPFERDGIIRVGGRLRYSTCDYDQIHPILLPADHHVSKLIMRETHVAIGHAAPERTLSENRRRFWVIRGRNLVKGIVRSCAICRKLRQQPHSTIMGNLPPERMKLFSPPFFVTGVDLFGPFQLKILRNRTVKAWGALFTCATMRAIHLEIVEDLSTQSFLLSLRRFASNHGWPETFISDNGKSFVGAQKELKKLFIEGQKEIQDFILLHKVRWIFTTPRSPHQGGIYESLIKQTKNALKIVAGGHKLTWNEMSTIFAEVKCLINSRPLGYTCNNPNDPQPITPNHLLFGRASAEIPQGQFRDDVCVRKRFEFVQSIINQFWKRFIREYFPTLNRRAKWYREKRPVQVGDVVLVTDENVPRGQWQLARIVELYPGRDGVIRNVKVKTQTGMYQRSIQRLCPVVENDNM